MSKYIIIYHRDDNDGVCSAAILKHYLIVKELATEGDITMFPATYTILTQYVNEHGGIENAFKDWDNIIMTDMSFDTGKWMIKLHEMYGSRFTWIDHHAPIIAEVDRANVIINGVQRTECSAILNAYKYCWDVFDTEYLLGKAPLVLVYLSAWDSFSFERENLDRDEVRMVNTAFTSMSEITVDWYYERMDKILTSWSYNQKLVAEALELGRRITEKKDKADADMIARNGIGGFTVGPDNRSAVAIFLSGPTNSIMFKSVAGKYQHGIVFKSDNTGNIVVSLYNVVEKHDFHCGEYLKNTYGGGGHEGAAGCTLTIDKFTKIMKTKHI